MTEPELETKLVEARDNGTIQSYGETLALCRILIQRPLSRILEIGSGRGSTPIWEFLLEGKGLVVTVDISPGFYGMIADTLDPNLVKFILADSTEKETIAKVREYFDYGTVDFLFIDAQHAYNWVKSDYLNYAPFVKSGGIIALHDTLMAGPGAVLKELKNEGSKVTEVTEGCGLGIISNSNGEKDDIREAK